MTDTNADRTVVFDHSDPAMIPVLHETYRDLRDRARCRTARSSAGSGH